jgi:hypothetical protein
VTAFTKRGMIVSFAKPMPLQAGEVAIVAERQGPRRHRGHNASRSRRQRSLEAAVKGDAVLCTVLGRFSWTTAAIEGPHDPT